MRKRIANIITSCRILCSILLLFRPVFSVNFYILYLFCGFTDMADGIVARKTNTVSEFGAKLDSVADMIFTAVCLYKFLPAIYIQDYIKSWLWKWIVIITLIKINNYIWGFILKRKIISPHTTANKITGLFLFLLPLTLRLIDLRYSVPVVCAMATFSAVQEGYYIATSREII